jgi:apolipoprotein N-acyltransferase
VIDPLGRLVARSAYGTREVIRARVEPLDVVTPYQRVGDLFPTLVAGFAVLWCLIPERVRARTRLPRAGVRRFPPWR